MGDYLHYTQKVWCRSWLDTCSFFGGWRFFVLPALLFVGGLLFHWRISQDWTRFTTLRLPPMMDEVVVYALYGFASVGLLFVLVFAINLCLAPYRLYRELRAEKEKSECCIKELQQDLEEVATNDVRPVLRIEYQREKHFTDRGSAIEVRLVVKNDSEVEAQRVRVTMESLIAETKKRKAYPFSTQFNALKLHVLHGRQGMYLHPGDSMEVLVVKVPRDGGYFFIEGYDNAGQPMTYQTVRAKYRVNITATAWGAKKDHKTFILTPQKAGRITFRQA